MAEPALYAARVPASPTPTAAASGAALAGASATAPAPGWVTPRALVRLCAQSQGELWGLKLIRLYGVGVGISYAIVALLMAPEPASMARLWLRCLQTASWVAGVGALSLANDLRARDSAAGLLGLARLRGYDERALERARALAGALRLAKAVAIPGALFSLAAAAKLRSLPGAASALGLLLLTLPYAALLGVTLALLARGASRALPERGRTVFLLLVLGPWLADAVLGNVPSVPGAFAWLLKRLAGGLT